MRRLAWIIVGLGIATATLALGAYAIDMDASYRSFRGGQAAVSWYWLEVGAELTAFGILLLAIRPPAPATSSETDDRTADAGTEPYH